MSMQSLREKEIARRQREERKQKVGECASKCLEYGVVYPLLTPILVAGELVCKGKEKVEGKFVKVFNEPLKKKAIAEAVEIVCREMLHIAMDSQGSEMYFLREWGSKEEMQKIREENDVTEDKLQVFSMARYVDTRLYTHMPRRAIKVLLKAGVDKESLTCSLYTGVIDNFERTPLEGFSMEKKSETVMKFSF